jgi:hypothetical protein
MQISGMEDFEWHRVSWVMGWLDLSEISIPTLVLPESHDIPGHTHEFQTLAS